MNSWRTNMNMFKLQEVYKNNLEREYKVIREFKIDFEFFLKCVQYDQYKIVKKYIEGGNTVKGFHNLAFFIAKRYKAKKSLIIMFNNLVLENGLLDYEILDEYEKLGFHKKINKLMMSLNVRDINLVKMEVISLRYDDNDLQDILVEKYKETSSEKLQIKLLENTIKYENIKLLHKLIHTGMILRPKVLESLKSMAKNQANDECVIYLNEMYHEDYWY